MSLYNSKMIVFQAEQHNCRDVKGRPAFVFAEHGVFVALAVHPFLFTQHIVMLVATEDLFP